MKKRLFAGLLSLLMLWTMLPVSALAVGETEVSQTAYFYVLKPESMDTPGLGTTEIANFYYVGTGEIIGAPAPADTDYKGAKIFIDEAGEKWNFTPPAGDKVDNLAKKITYNDTEYTYVPKEQFDSSTETNKYYIEWYRYSSASGANSNNPDHPLTQGYSWHIDGYPVLSGQYIINYEVKLPEKDNFSPYMENDRHIVQYVAKTEGAAFPADDAPSPDSINYGGVTYTFEGWYTDTACTKEATDSTLLSALDGDKDNQITFYGKYVPDTKVYVYADAGNLENNTKTYLTEVLGITLGEHDFFPLGVLSNAELEAAMSDNQANDNQKEAVKTAAKKEKNFEFSDKYNVQVTPNQTQLEEVTYTETTQAVIRDWIEAYADGELECDLNGRNDTKEFGITEKPGEYNWHLDIKLTDNILPTVTVTPANITIYTGGKGYGGVTNGEGNIIDETKTSGLPEPGYHLELTKDVQQWLTENGIADGSNLTDELHFTYNVDGTTRDWKLNYVGVYSTEPTTRYVYSLAPATVDGSQIPVRLAYTDAEGNAVDDDDILMTETSVNATYTMSIDSGDLDQSQIKAQFTVNGKTFNCNVEVGTGKLTVKSVTTPANPTTNEITSASNPTPDSNIITAAAGENVKYYVNDSEVEVENENNRVQLLVDDVSNSDAFNNDMGTHAIGEVEEEYGNLTNPASESAYLDLVDTENGNAFVTMGDSDELTIYWPMPADAQDASHFYIVHYTDMDRSVITSKDALNDQETEVIEGIETADGKYITFTADSFSPFVLVWSEATPTDPDPEPDPDPDPNPDPDPHPGGSTTTYYTLTYESNGGTEYDDERYLRNRVVELDKVPTREGYTFTGWYADEELTERITEIKMTSDKTVYAGWEATGVPDWLNGDDHFAYVIGYPDGMVKPQNNISRAEVATIFFRLLKPEIRDEYLTQTNQFTDVSGSAWYNTAVSTMAALDIVKGRTPTTFVPDAPITRAEFAAVCARFDTHLRDGDSDFSDISGHWAEAEIERAATLGWINGYPDGTFRPDNAITRAEAMTMINRVLQRLPEDEDDLLPDMNVWPDNQPQDWYYLAVQEATNSHDFDRKHDGVHEHWTDMNADPNWTQYQ